MNNLYFYKAIIRSVYDGDTLTADIDLGFGTWINGAKLRLDGVDTPELRGTSDEEKTRAIEVRDWVREKTLEKEVMIKSLGKGKYGRHIVQIWVLEKDILSDITINDELIKLGMAEKY
jgi:micrococcal nuclease